MLFNADQYLNKIFDSNINNFEELALDAFRFQYTNNSVYQQYCHLVGVNNCNNITSILQIPFLPIEFFKQHKVLVNNINPQITFTSSSTTQTGISQHYVSDVAIYERSFVKSFENVFGSTKGLTILALLPGYLEREGSSLIYMVNKLIALSQSNLSGFFLNNTNELNVLINHLEQNNESYLLIGVTHALLDFTEAYKPQIKNGKVLETGGMKGRKKELIRKELYELLKSNTGLNQIYSEYGMTELLSQAYSVDNGMYECAPWMKVQISEVNDPFIWCNKEKSGVINIIDLANIYSCCFIKTADIGISYLNGNFEVLGRLDNSDLRGCSLMAV